MEHLTHDTLARLVDERPSPGERKHLQMCSRCAEELRALRLQSDALGSLAALRPPSGDWESLEARLVGEGSSVRRRPSGALASRRPRPGCRRRRPS